jgi:hypothetical protein
MNNWKANDVEVVDEEGDREYKSSQSTKQKDKQMFFN